MRKFNGMQFLYRKFFVSVGALLVTLLAVAVPEPASAYTYNSYTAETINVTQSSTTLGGKTNVTLTFTMPMSMTTSGSLYVSTPYLYSYAGGSYTSDYVDLTNATITSSQLTKSSSYSSSSYLSFTPTAALASGTSVTITITDAVNPDIEGTGTYSVSGYENSSSGVYNSFYGSVSQVYGTVDLTYTVYDANGTTPVSGVNVYLSYYNTGNYSDYQYFYGYTNSSGQVQFAGLTTNRTYTVYLYYNGTKTDNDPPSGKTLTYNGSSPMTASVNFVTANVLTHFQDKNGTAVSNTYWYFYKTDYTDYNTNYVWRYGTTDSTGKIAGAADKDGSYILYAADANYNYYSYEFTISNGVESGLADPIKIPTPEVSGTVTAGGVAVSNAYVSIHNSNWTVSRYAYTDTSGGFTFALGKSGTYKVEISSYGLPTDYFAPDPTSVTVTAGTANPALSLALIAPTKTVSGTITMKSDAIARITAGTPVTDATVYAYQSSGSYGYAYDAVDSNGNFSMKLRGGNWKLYMYQNVWPASWAYTGDSLSAEFANDSTTESASFSIQVLPYNAHITGDVVYPDGRTVGSGDVYIYGYGGENSNVYSYAYTDANGHFDLKTTAGKFSIYMYFYSSSGSTNYSLPTIPVTSVDGGATVDLGDVTLLEKTSEIQGTVSLRSNSEAIADQDVYAYKEGTWEWASDKTDSQGAYNLKVSAGNWTVYTYTWGKTTSSGKSIINSNSGKSVTVAEKEVVTGIDFPLDIADSTVSFTVKDNKGTELTDQYGWVSLTESGGGDYGWYSLGCYVSRGTCTLDASSDVKYGVKFYTYSSWGWNTTDESESYTFDHIEVGGVTSETLSLASSATTTADLILVVNDVTVSGSFLNDAKDPVEISGEVYATNENGGWAYAYVNDASTYSMKLSAGTWNLNYYTWGSWYANHKDGTTQKITVASGDSVTQNFFVLDTDATISGTVLDADGNAVTNPTFVKASTNYGDNETDTGEKYGLIEQTTYTDDAGKFSMEVPTGTYYVAASAPGLLDPQPITVNADTAGSAKGIVLQFVDSDATISGTVVDGVGIAVNNRRSLAVGDGVSGAYIYAYSSNGSAVTAEADTSGVYSLPAALGEQWYIGAIYEVDTNAYYSEQTAVTVSDAKTTQNIVLSKTLTLPADQTIQFDPQDATVLSMENGVEINIPANAVTTKDLTQVTVTAKATIKIGHEAEERPVSIGYEFTALDDAGNPISEFADKVTITIPYDEADLTAAGVTEADLSMGYYVTAADEWETVESGVIDTEANQYVITADHFSTFAVVAAQSVIAGADSSSGDDSGDDSSGGSGDSGGDSADSGDGSGSGSSEETATTENGILNIPSKLTVKKRTARTMQLSWKGDADAAAYEIAIVNAKKHTIIKKLTSKKATKVLKKLKSNQQYELKVRSRGATGSVSGWSKLLAAQTKPLAPTNVSVKDVTSMSATVSWRKPRGVVKQYIVSLYQGDELISSSTTKQRSAVVSSLQSGVEYRVKVQAKFNKKNVSAYSSAVTFTTLLNVVK